MKRQIEDYLRARGAQYFRGHHDDEFFFLVDYLSGANRGRLNVHLRCDDEADTVVVSISPDRYYPAEKAAWLGALADRWNADNPLLRAAVHGSCDSRLVGVQASGHSRSADADELAGFVDAAVVAGIDLFGRTSDAALPGSNVALRDAG